MEREISDSIRRLALSASDCRRNVTAELRGEQQAIYHRLEKLCATVERIDSVTRSKPELASVVVAEGIEGTKEVLQRTLEKLERARLRLADLREYEAKTAVKTTLPPKEFLSYRPSNPHVKIETNQRVFVVGDVHGCIDEMEKLLAFAKVNSSTVVVFAGDLINKGPDNIAALRLARKMDAYVVRGNHEEAVLRHAIPFHREGIEPEEAYKWVEELSEEDLLWLAELPYTIRVDPANVIVVHAGLDPRQPIDHQSEKLMVTVRDYKDSEKEISVPIGSVWPGPEMVYFGHDAKRGLQRHRFAIGLDTGCVYGRELTGVYVDEPTKLFQVKAAKVYSVPNIKPE